MKKICKFSLCILPALLLAIATASCDKNDDAIDTKGGISTLLQNIESNND